MKREVIERFDKRKAMLYAVGRVERDGRIAGSEKIYGFHIDENPIAEELWDHDIDEPLSGGLFPEDAIILPLPKDR
jgi:hypothetical protein